MNVLSLTKTLVALPELPTVAGAVIRDYRGPADIAVWLDIRQQAFRDQLPAARPWRRADFESEMLRHDAGAAPQIWFAERMEAAVAVGSVSLAIRATADAVRPAVHWLAVPPPWRHQGIARLLMAHLERYCWQHGMYEIRLETHAGWTAAVQLYQSLGYR